MSNSDHLVPLLDTLRDLIAWFDSKTVPGVIIGGVAASLLGRPRVTRDVDAVIILEERLWEDFLKSGISFGFVPRRTDTIPFARKNRILLVHHKPSGIDADISLGALSFEKEMIAHGTSIVLNGVKIPLPRPEDLLVMKTIARRPRDIADIESILDANKTLNLRIVRRWIRAFSASLEMPEILEEFENIVARQRRKNIKKK